MKRLLPAFAFCASLLSTPASAQAWGSWKNDRYQPAPHQATYRLPFDERKLVRVDQGPNGRYSHDDDANRDAVDFALPEGTPVLAARDGVVVQLRDGMRDNYAQRPGDDASEAGDFVRIRHADGSIAMYAHLHAGSVRVRSGQRVQAGDCVALSGNTGFSTAPHLHFVVQVQRDGALRSVPVRIESAQGVLKFPRQSN